ncbi:pyridoxal 5'-phosphate synthase subunit PdxT [Bacteroidia bacterium]|nr:pyridoxal 5'-phosphate synthase subunit PdxT [Bacteroidia bacterium]GHT64970.1 pyridoxal 5'-phosphate synthase subunit PdxT [Bacteroidia bacterium]
MDKQLKIGVLALQGGFAEHIRSLQSIGAETFEIRKRHDLNQPMDGLVIPGGESTVISKLLDDLDLFVPLKEKIDAGLPVFGTCAGLILLANRFRAIDIVVKRNAYGRQLGSFSVEAEMKGIGRIPMIFIRAPYIESAGKKVEILSVVDGHIVAARQKNILVTSFHPELTSDTRIHNYFTEMLTIADPAIRIDGPE